MGCPTPLEVWLETTSVSPAVTSRIRTLFAVVPRLLAAVVNATRLPSALMAMASP